MLRRAAFLAILIGAALLPEERFASRAPEAFGLGPTVAAIPEEDDLAALPLTRQNQRLVRTVPVDVYGRPRPDTADPR